MALPIRQNATHKVVVGPFVAVGDGFTPVTTLTLTGGTPADEAEAILHDNGTVVSIAAYTWAAIATADGYYHLTLQSGITSTIGHLTIVINDDSLTLPVKADFVVIEEAVYDAFYASAADLHTAAISDIESSLVIVSSDTLAIEVDTSTTLSAQITTIASDLILAQADVTVILSDTTAIEIDTSTTLSAQVTTIASDLILAQADITVMTGWKGYSDLEFIMSITLILPCRI